MILFPDRYVKYDCQINFIQDSASSEFLPID